MTAITITLTALAVPGLTLLNLEKVLDNLIVPGVVIEDYEIEGLDDDADHDPTEEAYYERVDYEYDRRMDK